MKKKYRILRIKGFNENNDLIVDKKTRYNVADLDEEDKLLFFKYKKQGVLITDIKLEYEIVNSLRVTPIEVYRYMKENEVDITRASIHFNLAKATIIRYIERVTNYE